jgi:hypothetical protein
MLSHLIPYGGPLRGNPEPDELAPVMLSMKDSQAIADLVSILYNFPPGSGNARPAFPIAATAIGVFLLRTERFPDRFGQQIFHSVQDRFL